MTNVCARTHAGCRHWASCVPPGHRSSKREWSRGRNSAGSHRSIRAFNGIICDEISEFEALDGMSSLREYFLTRLQSEFAEPTKRVRRSIAKLSCGQALS